MKRSLLAGLFGLLLLSGGCGPGITDSIFDNLGKMRGELDDDPWLGTAESDLTRDTLVIWSRRRNVNAEHSLVLTFVQTAPGVYAVVTESMSSSAATAYWETVGGDVAVYHAAATSGTIAFTRLDRTTGRAAGTVELTLQGPRGTSRFIRGEFDAMPFAPRR
jgi:hypothetical protein